MVSFSGLLNTIYGIAVMLYTTLNGIQPFSDFPVTLFQIMVGLILAGIVWRILGHKNFNEEEEDE